MTRVIVAAMWLLVSGSALAQAPVRPPASEALPEAIPLIREGITTKLGPHTYGIIDDAIGVPNVGIVVGRQATLVINTGLGRRNGETVLRELAKVSKNRDLYVAFTHEHPNTMFGYNAFPADVKIVMSRIQEAEFTKHAMDTVRWLSTRTPEWAELLKDATPRKATILYDNEYTIDLGGVRVRLIGVGPTHAPGDTLFFIEEDRVLFGGDVIENGSFLAAGAGSSIKAWLAAFDRADSLRPRVVVPSHGPVGDAGLIDVNRRIMAAIQARVVELKAKGDPVDRIAATVQKEMQGKYPDWDSANSVGAAARAAYAEAR